MMNMSRRKKRKFTNASEHNELGIRHPALNCIEMLEIAEVAVPKPTARYSSPTAEQETFGFKQRREHRLIPTLPPITPASQWNR
jgi:hypothetical protein